MSDYQQMIIKDTGCPPADATMIEHIMRDDIFHGTLDWQTRHKFRQGAREAASLLAANRPLYDEYFARTRAVFEEMQRASKP